MAISLQQIGEHFRFGIGLLRLSILFSVVLACQSKVNSLGFFREEHFLEVVKQLLLSDGLQFFDFNLLSGEAVLVNRDLSPKSFIFFRKVNVFFSHTSFDSLNLLFELIISHILDLLSEFCQEDINSIDHVLTCFLS